MRIIYLLSISKTLRRLLFWPMVVYFIIAGYWALQANKWHDPNTAAPPTPPPYPSHISNNIEREDRYRAELNNYNLALNSYHRQHANPNDGPEGTWLLIALCLAFFWVPAAIFALIGRIVARDWRKTPVGATFREPPRQKKLKSKPQTKPSSLDKFNRGDWK